jgi:hypothetical protein
MYIGKFVKELSTPKPYKNIDNINSMDIIKLNYKETE